MRPSAQSVRTTPAPGSGACALARESSSLEEIALSAQRTNQGACTACSNSVKPFLLYGGCSEDRLYICSRPCSESGSNACEQWSSASGWIFSKNAGAMETDICAMTLQMGAFLAVPRVGTITV
ncbi:hypothetical protein GL50803_00116575 [Giardia duodenalis]|uniref:Uncharacterized protein n=1 Tax=Giardia intestinalis (strain ATCC 50803 / WB clone C6) TaxID=184922 RepID=D3KHX1_GIAIC|nr:hypothetical protein GL50803_00116574 [Giardia intestinalis]XP_037902165.1 hypothetical protein GL50803_00116575 [Giardia intestinalis]KAE8304728.1 hypothetical protein GL50803_00116574 [Giardia intestinalis]KAE8304799.1 hypothetical protein GL50803_00116575 [Giardia intestinalis]